MLPFHDMFDDLCLQLSRNRTPPMIQEFRIGKSHDGVVRLPDPRVHSFA